MGAEKEYSIYFRTELKDLNCFVARKNPSLSNNSRISENMQNCCFQGTGIIILLGSSESNE